VAPAVVGGDDNSHPRQGQPINQAGEKRSG
jgi:hypothetical protein